jgi:hypothetical protein
VLLYRRKGTTYKALVEIIRVVGSAHDGDPPIINYVIRSELGGTMTVGPRQLRPGNVLDRIAAALEDD